MMQRLLCPLFLGYVNIREQRLQAHYLCPDLFAEEIWLENRISFHGKFDSSRFVFVVNEKVGSLFSHRSFIKGKKIKESLRHVTVFYFHCGEIYFTLVICIYLVLIC